jgi:hypothetical protein
MPKRTLHMGPTARQHRASGPGMKPLALMCVAAFALTLLPAVPASAQTSTRAHVACAPRGEVVVYGYEALINNGWTTEEASQLVVTLDSFFRRVCPAQSYLAIAGSSIYPKHVDDETIWQFTFRITIGHNRHYQVTAQIPNLLHMSVTLRSATGKVIYRSGTVPTA